MYRTKIKYFVPAVAVLAVLTFATRLISARASATSDGPELPPQCASINVDDTEKLALHVYAKGVQIYKWNATTFAWDFDAPRASLYAEQNFFGEVGSHYRGPTWESKSGSFVKAKRVLGTGCTPDPSAIEWLLLVNTENSGPGIFDRITHIQRVNTTGGLRPTMPGSYDGEIKEVPYTAEYYFYRLQNLVAGLWL